MRWDQIAAQRRREGRGARAVRVLQRVYAKTRFGLLVTGVCCIGVGIVTLLPG